MASDKSSTSAAGKAAASSPVPAGLAPAGESGDPAIHKLLADLETARSNGDDDGVQAAVKALADLGYEAS